MNSLRPVGRGGMGRVYLARHNKLGREVAIKVLAWHRLHDEQMRQRFETEMRAVGRLSHPNIVTAHDAREVDGMAVLVMEFIEGVDLAELLRRTGPLSIKDACEITRRVATALQYTSEQGFVHRDIKPSNIMISNRGEVKLLDLGLARWQSPQPESQDHISQMQIELTAAGQALGSADFIAPEQVNDSRSVDARSDIYSLGCTLFTLLTGSAPFSSENCSTAFAKMSAHVSTAAPSLSTTLPGTPAKLVKLVQRMLAKSPNDRPQVAGELLSDLEKLAKHADLEKLIQKAIEHGPASEPASSKLSSPVPQGGIRRVVPQSLAIGGALLGTLIGFCLGIIITIKFPDGTTTDIEVPDGSQIGLRSSAATPDVMEKNSTKAPTNPAVTQEAKSVRNLKSIGIAFRNFESAYRQLPGSVNVREGSVGERGKKIYPFSWRVAILPFVEQNALFVQYNFNEPWDSESNLKLLDKMPDVYSNGNSPADVARGLTCYRGFAGENGALGTQGGYTMGHFSDGTSNTLLVMESNGFVPWTQPVDIEFTNFDDTKDRMMLFAGRRFKFVMADGAVRIMDPINWEILGQLATRNGRERIPARFAESSLYEPESDK